MFDIFGRFHRHQEIERRCTDCGARTIYYRCDPCSRRATDVSAAEADHVADQPTVPLPAIKPQQPQQPQPTQDSASLTAEDRAYLATLPEPDPHDLDQPFPGYAPLLYPTLPESPALPVVAALGDVFAETVVWLRLHRETLPPIRADWSSDCPWCAKELREASDDAVTHKPLRSRIRTCDRHREGQLALSRWMHREDFGGDEWLG